MFIIIIIIDFAFLDTGINYPGLWKPNQFKKNTFFSYLSALLTDNI